MLEQMAIQQGISAAQLMIMGDNAESKAAFNEAYEYAARRSNLLEVRDTAQKNLSAIRQDKVLSDAKIQLNQNQAEAMVMVQAAAAGVEGGSVEDTIYETHRNEALSIANNKKRVEQASEQYLAQIGSTTSTLLTIEEPQQDTAGALFNLGADIASDLMGQPEGHLEQEWGEVKESFTKAKAWFGGLFNE